MDNNIYTAENSLDMFDMEIPQFEMGTEVQSPQIQDNNQSEFDSFLDKSFISFGTMAVCIVFIIIIALIIKNKKQKNKVTIEEKIQKLPEEKNTKEEFSYTYEAPQKKQINHQQILNTPGSIHKCIKSFLENTKDI